MPYFYSINNSSMSNNKITNEEIHNLIMDLGSNIPDDFVWSDELRKKFEEITSYLNSIS